MVTYSWRLDGLATRDCEDPAAALLPHMRQDRTRNEERGPEVEVQHLLESRVIGFRNAFAACEAAHDVDQRVDAAETRHNLFR